MKKNKVTDFFKCNFAKTIRCVIIIISLITLVSVFVPFSPRMPEAKLDGSWEFGMNQALAQGISIGSDIIFTYGPYSSVLTKSYHPRTDALMIYSSLFLAISYWICFVIITNKTSTKLSLIYCLFLAGFMFSRDALLLSYPLIAGLAAYKILNGRSNISANSRFNLFLVAILFTAAGMLPLIKGSLLILCCAIVGICSLYFVVQHQNKYALACISAYLCSMVLFWSISGQSIATLPQYLINMIPIVSGYTEAMALNGSRGEIITFILASLVLLLSVGADNKIDIISRIYICTISFMFLFVSFKGGFIRHDYQHATMASTVILFAALLLALIIQPNLMVASVAIAIFTSIYIDSHHKNTSTSDLIVGIKTTYSSTLKGIRNRLTDDGSLPASYKSTVDALRDKASFPVLKGSSDIYSHHQSLLIASGNTWAPRPIFQSYSAYTPTLIEKNKNHLLGPQAPENIIFKVEPLNGRVPSIEDGGSWPVLLTNYHPEQGVNGFLFLKKNTVANNKNDLATVRSEQHLFGEYISIPQSDKILFVKFKINSTLLGRIVNIFYKPSEINLSLKLADGSTKTFSLITTMAASDFLISPFIENTSDFELLYRSDFYHSLNRVQSLAIQADSSAIKSWNSKYEVIFSELR